MSEIPTVRRMHLAEKTILGAIAGAATSFGIVSLVFAIIQIVEVVSSPTTTLYGIPLVEPMPVAGTLGTTETVDVTVTGLPAGAIAALTGAIVLDALLTLAICAAVAWLCVRVFVGKPFVRSTSWSIGVVAILALCAALLGPFLNGIAAAEAALIVGSDALPDFMFVVNGTPIGWAFALAVVAAAFEIGQRMQRETDGLI